MLGNVRESNKTLDEIQPILSASGVRVITWLMDDKERLYTHLMRKHMSPYLQGSSCGAWRKQCGKSVHRCSE